MIKPDSPHSSDVDQLLRNAQLRDALEPLLDESISRVNAERMTTRCENEFLESMLEWERAPMLPICQWFDPKLQIPAPDELNDDQLGEVLTDTIGQLFTKHVVLDFTDHLDDRALYCIIYRDILPAYEKQILRESNYLHWDCANIDGDQEIWLRYYACQEEREMWAFETRQTPPMAEEPPCRRRLPRAEM